MTMNWKDISILVVEDDKEMREVLCDFFKKFEFQIFSAENGQVALKIVDSEKIQIILSDVQMPVMDGVQLLKHVRSKDGNVPIFLLATGQSQLSEVAALNLGANGLVHKPFNFKNLLLKIQETMVEQN